MSQPSTPLQRGTAAIGKMFNTLKMRTPGGNDVRNGILTSSTNNYSNSSLRTFSTPSLLRRSSSKNSVSPLHGIGSTLTMDSLDSLGNNSLDIEVPKFESGFDWLNDPAPDIAAAPTTLPAGANPPNKYSRPTTYLQSNSESSLTEDDSPAPYYKDVSKANNGSRGVISEHFTSVDRSKDQLKSSSASIRSTTKGSKPAEVKMSGRKGSAVVSEERPTRTQYLRSGSDEGVLRVTEISSSSGSDNTPGLSRALLGKTGPLHTLRRPINAAGGSVKLGKARRVPIADNVQREQEDASANESEGADVSNQSRGISPQSAASTSPATNSPGRHLRSQSEIPLPSPKHLVDHQVSATTTIPHQLSASTYLNRTQGRSVSAMGNYVASSSSSTSTSTVPTRSVSSLGFQSKSGNGYGVNEETSPDDFGRSLPSKRNALTRSDEESKKAQVMPMSASLRQRMLLSSSSSNPGFEIENKPPSPSLPLPYRSPMSSEDEARHRREAALLRKSSSSRMATLESRRSQLLEQKMAERASMEELRQRNESAKATTYDTNSAGFKASFYSERRLDDGLNRSALSTAENQEETILARPGKTPEMLSSNITGSTTIHSEASTTIRFPSDTNNQFSQAIRSRISPSTQSEALYHSSTSIQDENQYRTNPQTYQQTRDGGSTAGSRQPATHVNANLQSGGRQILSESYRAPNALPLSGYAHEQQQQQQQPRIAKSLYTRENSSSHDEFQVPLRDRSPGMAESTTPSYSYQQHHYNGQSSQHQSQHQQQHQQQHYQLQHSNQQHQNHSQHQQSSYSVQLPPEQAQSTQPARSVKKILAPLVVNGKPYHRVGMLGKGGSSKVYRVIDVHNQIFAIKKVEIKTDAETKASFINEIDLLKKLAGNPQIIQLVDSEICEAKKVLYMVLEVGETDLNNLLMDYAGKAISLNFIRYIWEQILQAVQVMHSENIVHTDLKPANFVLVKGRLKLIDFGISKKIEGDTTNIAREEQIGTANYMSPEALSDSGQGLMGKKLMKLGRASDVWSLGCILYQMVYGRTPFSHLVTAVKVHEIKNPRHRINYASTACPVDERGEEKKGMTVTIGPVLLATMKSCFVFDQKKRATIPELLNGAFLRMDTGNEGSLDISEANMLLVVERLGQIITQEGSLSSGRSTIIARKLMEELKQAKAIGA